MSIITRFAPSPTGFLHIGGVRTALFNWLHARHHGGKFLLRIEDTDSEREVPGATAAILEALDWLGLHPDEPPVFQRAREPRHAEVAHELLRTGKAYLAFDTPEELAAMREAAMKEGRPPRYNGYWRDRDPSEAPPGAKGAIRIKAPREGETVVHDLVQGTIHVANAELDDMIILRSDGRPTYLHAVVVDDHDMNITTVIRGDDHITNTFRQRMVYDAMGWTPPAFAHIPLIHGADGAKLSKRHGAVNVMEFRERGYLPEGLINYLLRLGWGHGDTEIVGREEAVKLFDVSDVGRAASRMDYAKLDHVNGVWLRQADDTRLTADVIDRLTAREGLRLDDAAKARIRTLMPGLKERARTLVELADAAAFLARPAPFAFDAKAAALLTDTAKTMLRELAVRLKATPFEAAQLHDMLKAFAEEKGVKLGAVAQPLRAALTGTTTSPPIDATLAALGPDETQTRIAAAVA